jgi:general transcription factor 3C polypeptide 3 (transcription factor C subunit 4)
MGEANAAYVSEDYNKVEVLCREVIAQAPHVPDPYVTLGMMYLERNQRDLALKYKLVASLCLPESSVDWHELAVLSAEQEEYVQALHFYDKAMRAEPGNLQRDFEHNALRVKLGQRRRAITGFLQILRQAPGDMQVLF